jgi:RNA polymerase sigma factor (sigma-70 family)
MDTGVEEYSRAGGSTDKLIKVQIEHTAQTVQNEEEPEQRPAQRETQMRIALEEVSYGGPETFTTNQEEPKSNPEDRRQATEAQPVAQQDSAIGADESATVTEHDQHEEEVDGVSDQSPPTQAEETSTGEQAATRLELLHQGANGDDEALAELLMKHYYKELVRFASARIDRSRAEDIVSDVVTRLLIRPEAIEVREPAPLSAFRNMLYTAIRNRVIDYGRHDTMMRRIGERDYVEALIMTIPEPSLAPDLEAVRQDVWRRVIGILEREMMKSQVNVFYDVYVLGLSIPECAAHRHIPTGTAKRRAMAARRVLRKAVLSGELELW